MRNLCLVGLALLGAVLGTDAVSADCVRFSKDTPCEVKSGPINQLHFGVGKSALQTLPSAGLITKPSAPAADVQAGNDCAMIKKLPPDFSSAMRVIKPDPKVKHAMRVTIVPPCKPS